MGCPATSMQAGMRTWTSLEVLCQLNSAHTSMANVLGRHNAALQTAGDARSSQVNPLMHPCRRQAYLHSSLCSGGGSKASNSVGKDWVADQACQTLVTRGS